MSEMTWVIKVKAMLDNGCENKIPIEFLFKQL